MTRIISGSNSGDILSRGSLISEIRKVDFWFCGPKFLCTKCQFDSVGQNSCLVDNADGSSQFCFLGREKRASESYFFPNVIQHVLLKKFMIFLKFEFLEKICYGVIFF